MTLTIKFSKTKLFLIFVSMFFSVVRADVIEMISGVESGRFIEGVNLSDNSLSVSLAAEWSSDSGAFVSLHCFVGENNFRNSIQRGCDGRLGWFTPISDNQAFTLAVSQHDYSSPVLSDWHYTDLNLNWHMSKLSTLRVHLSESLLGQGFRSVTTSFMTSRAVNNHWRIQLEAGLIGLESSAPVNALEYGLLGAEYSSGRWSTQLKAMLSSSDYQQFVNLDHAASSLSLSIRYRLY